MKSGKGGPPGGEDGRDFMLALYRECRGIMFTTVGKLIADPDEQEDVIQDSLEKLLRHVDALRWKDRPVRTAYVVQTVRNTAINHLRRKEVERRLIKSCENPDGQLAPLTLEELMDIRERGEHMEEILAGLPETDRLLLTGKYILGYSDAELAEDLGVKPDSVRMMLTRARRRVLNAIKEREADEDD